MIQVLWEYTVRAEKMADFLRYYGGEGVWAQFFAKGAGYRGTTLLRDPRHPERCLTLDTWESLGAYEAFQRAHADEYAALDRAAESFMAEERLLGLFEVVEPEARRALPPR